jgi:hypothetical protein
MHQLAHRGRATAAPTRRGACLAIVAILAPMALVPTQLAAQAWSYPSFQTPRVSQRDFSVAVASAGDAGTSLVGQWREGIDPRSHFGVDFGIADPSGRASTRVLIGGSYAYKLADARVDQPIDFLLTAGANGAFGGGSSLFRIPVGLSVGHRFPLDQGMAITPYVHPRVSIDVSRVSVGGESVSDSQIGVDFDVGASLDITRELALRASAVFSGSDLGRGSGNGFGIALTWTPPMLSRYTR